jgi:hypothetical protein
MSFGRELVVLLTKPSMFGKFLVHALPNMDVSKTTNSLPKLMMS